MAALQLVKGVGATNDLALDASITRAQLVTILVRAFGQESNARLLNGAAAFLDTAHHPWASGSIAMAKRLIEQRTNGRETIGLPDGSFNPDGNVTAAEAIAFIMKFLGAPKDESASWPTNYLNGALKAGIITGEDLAMLGGIKNAPATRGLVFYVADSAFYNFTLPEGGTVYTRYVDTTPPAITLEPFAKTTDADRVTISGKVTDAVSLEGPHGPIAFDPATGRFLYETSLTPGPNSFAITARDVAGNRFAAAVTVTRSHQVARTLKTYLSPKPEVAVNHEAALVVEVWQGDQQVADQPYAVTVSGALVRYDPMTGRVVAGREPGQGQITVVTEDGLSSTLDVTVFNGLSMIQVISPPSTSLVYGETIQMSVIGLDYLGEEYPLSGPVIWSVSDPDAVITPSGELTLPAKSVFLRVTAQVDGKSASAFLVVNSEQ